jgi:hypothetical protein
MFSRTTKTIGTASTVVLLTLLFLFNQTSPVLADARPAQADHDHWSGVTVCCNHRYYSVQATWHVTWLSDASDPDPSQRPISSNEKTTTWVGLGGDDRLDPNTQLFVQAGMIQSYENNNGQLKPKYGMWTEILSKGGFSEVTP